MYAFFEKVEDDEILGKKRLHITRFQVPSDVGQQKTTLHGPFAVLDPDEVIDVEKDDSQNTTEQDMSIHRENLAFIYLDVNTPFNRDLIGPLRAINDHVHAYSNEMNCLHLLRYCPERVFLITTSNNRDFIKDAHDCSAVEAVFLWKCNVPIDPTKHPKFVGNYAHPQELLAAIRNAQEWFGQAQFESVLFEDDPLFLWCQTWREFLKPTNPRFVSTKDKLIDVGEKFYRKNNKLLKSVDDFDYCYERNEALQWCFISPFPSLFLQEALGTRDMKRMDHCRFLINDVSRLIQLPTECKTNREFYRGIKASDQELEKLTKYSGKLICVKGYFTCFKSRKVALDIARSSVYRFDLRPVLFKIDTPATVRVGEISTTSTGGLVVFDVYMTFRIKCVNVGQVTVVKLEPASEDGKQIARAYRAKNKAANLHNLLDQLIMPPTTIPPLPPIKRVPQEQPKKVSPPVVSSEEVRAEKFLQTGKVDKSLAIYENMKSPTPRALNTLANIYAGKKGDYSTAIKHYKQALQIQEKNGEDPTGTLTQLGIAHYNRREFDLSLEYHKRALELQNNNPTQNQVALASSLLGVANAKWGQDELRQAYDNASKALTLNESVESGNDVNLAMNLAVLANIHHKHGDEPKALECSKRALAILERSAAPDSLSLASVLNNMGAIQMSLGLFEDAQKSFKRALEICEKNLPDGHPKRVTMERNILRNEEIIRQYGNTADTKP